MTTVVDGHELAAGLRADVAERVDRLVAAGVRPGLGTVLMSDDDADRSYVERKREACEAVGVAGTHLTVDPAAPTGRLLDRVDALNDDPSVHGVFVQLPLPDHVDTLRVRSRVDPAKDVDGLHPTNRGLLAAGEPRVVPATPRAVRHVLSTAGVETRGARAVVVGRSAVVGRPTASLLVDADATVTVCHSRTADLAAETRRADVLVTSAGVPGLVDGSMLSPGVAVVDAGLSRVPADTERGYEVVGDVAFESAREVADVVTPVPGGVGPLTVAMLLDNVVRAASARAGVALD
jgi:methylenetetrahydrofolate dehydrogenase (NADP+)/methenyltetrahydrofolate cyclohydrolase